MKTVNEKQNIPDYSHILDLNKVRNDAEHSNIIPDVDTVRFYVKISGDFLKWSFSNYFGTDYDSLALENMIQDAGIRECMIKAKQLIEVNDLSNASAKLYEALGALKFLAFGYLSDPRVNGISFGDRSIFETDTKVSLQSTTRTHRGFSNFPFHTFPQVLIELVRGI